MTPEIEVREGMTAESGTTIVVTVEIEMVRDVAAEIEMAVVIVAETERRQKGMTSIGMYAISTPLITNVIYTVCIG